jgi:hypothetical protein
MSYYILVMRVQIETNNNEKLEGVVALKDESFLMVKLKQKVRILHWDHILNVKRVTKNDKQPINLDVFRKSRE